VDWKAEYSALSSTRTRVSSRSPIVMVT